LPNGHDMPALFNFTKEGESRVKAKGTNTDGQNYLPDPISFVNSSHLMLNLHFERTESNLKDSNLSHSSKCASVSTRIVKSKFKS